MRSSVRFWQLTRSPIARQVYDAQIPDLTTNAADEGIGTGHSADDWFDDVVGPGTILTALDRRVCRFTNLDDMHPRMTGTKPNTWTPPSTCVLTTSTMKWETRRTGERVKCR